ncbi:MAG: Ig-like domain repeat protein [Anaerolineales bacterium]|nr:Ig-like domain repeat protein [Anaerolineales bacterium]
MPSNSTLFDNAANPSGSGGGIYNSGPFELRNTLIAGAITAPNCVNTGAMIVNANNLVEDGSCSALWNGDPLLGALGDYGGPTWTLPLLPGSPAIDTANAADCLPTDQRGVTRTPAACDIGAFESQGFTLTLVGGDRQRTPVDFVFGEPLTLTVEAGSWQGKAEPIEAGQVTFAGPFTGAGITPVTQTTAVAADGVAAIALTANHVTGVYSVTATLQGGNPPLAYTLTNFAPTTPTVTSDPGTAVFGQVVTFTAVVTAPYGVPTGSITFTFASTDVVAPLVDAMATMTRSDLAVGDHVAVTVYGGESYFDPSQSAPYTQTVIRAGSEITVTTAPNPSATTDTVTFTATVTALPPGAGLPTGDVTFTVGATVFTAPLDVNGIATAQRNDLAVGVHAVSAAYPGDTNFTAATVNGAGQVVQATLTVFVDGTGVGSLASEPAGINCSGTCRARFDPSTLVTVTATPLISSTFTGWNGAVSGVGNPAVLTMDADKALTATFTIKTYVITPTAGVNGNITPATPQTLIYDAGARFDIIADPHHHILDVAVDNVSVGAVSAYTFTHVTVDHVITAAFAIDTHTLTVVKTGAGVGSVAQEPAGAVFDYGTVITLTAQPVLTSTFTNWSGDASGTTNPLLVTVDRDKEITGTFIIHPRRGSTLPTLVTSSSSRWRWQRTSARSVYALPMALPGKSNLATQQAPSR